MIVVGCVHRHIKNTIHITASNIYMTTRSEWIIPHSKRLYQIMHFKCQDMAPRELMCAKGEGRGVEIDFTIF